MKKLYTLLLMFPLVVTTTFADLKTIKYKVRKGESLYSIAKKNHTSIQTLRKINGFKKGTVLQVGKVLKVPAGKNTKRVVKKATTTPTKTVRYTVKKGDTLSKIAKKHRMSVANLRSLNGLRKGAVIQVGKKLHVSQSVSYYASHKKSTKKLASSLSRLKTVKLNKKNAVAAKSTKISFDDIFFSGSKKSSVRSEKMIKLAKKKLGKRYVWGATGKKNTFDCSGLTQYVCKKNGIDIPRTSIKQSKYGKFIPRSNLKKGDLVFFDTSKRRRGYVNHVGIYIGNNKFIHASSAKKKVVITSLDKPFYSQRFVGARRVASL